MKKIVLSFLLIVSMLSVVIGQKKKEINTPVTVSYCLPKVTFVVKVQVEHTRLIPGPYYQNAEKELGLKPEITAPDDRWAIKNIEVMPTYTPDEKATYTITASGDYHPVMLTLTPEGFLAGVAAGPMNMAVNAQGMTYRVFNPSTEKEIDLASLNTYNPMKEVLDTNYTVQEIDGVVKKIWDPIVRYTAKSREDNMNEAIKEIYRIRSERTKFVGADNGLTDGRALEVILKEFDRMEKDYLSLFMGERECHMETYTFMCSPEKEGEQTLAFRFSESEGVSSKKNVSAGAYFLQADNVFVPASTAASATPSSASSVFYRIPASCDLKLMKNNEELQRFRTVIPQLGVIKAFPTDVISNEGLILEFYPEYGALRSVNKK